MNGEQTNANCYLISHVSSVSDTFLNMLNSLVKYFQLKREITRARIIKVLKQLKFTKQSKNAHKIFAELTGELIDDIEYLEDD